MCGRVFSSLRGDRVREIARTGNQNPRFAGENRFAASYNIPPRSNLAAIVHRTVDAATDVEEPHRDANNASDHNAKQSDAHKESDNAKTSPHDILSEVKKPASSLSKASSEIRDPVLIGGYRKSSQEAHRSQSSIKSQNQDQSKTQLPREGVKLKEDENRKLTVLNWGWDINDLINARGEEMAEKPFFRRFLKNRCVIVVEGAFEWNKEKQPYKYVSKSEDHVLLAAVFNEHAQVILLTVEANSEFHDIHHRMPIFMTDDEIDDWINPNIDFNKVLNKLINFNLPKWSTIIPMKVCRLVSNLKEKSINNLLSEEDLLKMETSKGKTLESFFGKKKPQSEKSDSFKKSSLSIENTDLKPEKMHQAYNEKPILPSKKASTSSFRPTKSKAYDDDLFTNKEKKRY